MIAKVELYPLSNSLEGVTWIPIITALEAE